MTISYYHESSYDAKGLDDGGSLLLNSSSEARQAALAFLYVAYYIYMEWRGSLL